jgi:glycine cleavage system H protein
MAKTIEDLFYSESHEWVKVDGETAIIGISDHAQQAMGNIVYVDMPEEEDEVTANEDFGAVESVKAASDLISPVSGVVVEVNEALADAPELLNKDAYENWIIKVKMDDPEELKNLMDAAAYEKFCENEEH